MANSSERILEAKLFGQRISNHFIAAYVEQTELKEYHLYKWSYFTRMFNEWCLAKYRPELVP